jgi:hypothetical protein
MDLNYYCKYINFDSSNIDLFDTHELGDRYSEQYESAISPFDILINSSRADNIYKYGDKTLIPIKCVVDYGHKWNKSK